MRLFKRKAQILIGKLGHTGRMIEGIRIAFEIEMDDNKETNNGKISLYNLSKETIGILEQKGVSVILKVGYDDQELSTIFIGNVVKFEHDFTGFDVITKIKCKDGYIPLTAKKLSLSFEENSSSKQIIDKIIAEINVGKGDYSNVANFVYKQGFSFVGTPGTALDLVLSRLGYEWTIANNILLISKQNEPINSTIAQLISPTTGLIDKPKRFKEDPVKTRVKKNKLIDGWQINSLIIPSIQPKSLIKVVSEDVDAVFLVKKVRFRGDTHDAPWFCEMEAIER